uniref:Uncharacterized protein n=1 Tax=Romanomermis culicivorax TaxID=13658 RepID=A0A915IWC1_ROMCU
MKQASSPKPSLRKTPLGPKRKFFGKPDNADIKWCRRRRTAAVEPIDLPAAPVANNARATKRPQVNAVCRPILADCDKAMIINIKSLIIDLIVD